MDSEMKAILNNIAIALHRLGTNDAATPQGALELVAGEMGNIAAAIEGAYDADVSNSLNGIADAIEHLAEAIRDHA